MRLAPGGYEQSGLKAKEQSQRYRETRTQLFHVLDQISAEQRKVIAIVQKIHVARLRPSSGGKLQRTDWYSGMSFCPCGVARYRNAGRLGDSHGD